MSSLGRGGYAVVYMAHDEVTATCVALKVLRPDRLSRVALKRMSREAETMRRFQHDRLVKVLDHGTVGDGAYLVMEAVDGQTLRARREQGPLSTDEAIGIARDVLEGLVVLHRDGIVHRDVKPSNILLDRSGRAKLADFGLVSRWSDEQTRATQSKAIVGTIDYISPEQALGEELDGRSDLYSLGVVLFEMLSGAPLHGARSSLGMLVAHLTRPAPDVRASREDIPAWLSAVVSRMLEKDRRARYPSAEAALADLADGRAPRTDRSPLSKRRFGQALAAAAAVLILFLALRYVLGLQAAPLESVLAGAEVRGGLLRGINDKGGVMWTRDLGAPLDDAQFTASMLKMNSRLRVADLDGDGPKEVLITAEAEEGGLHHLFVFESDGRERFRHRPGRMVRYGKDFFDTFNATAVYFYLDSRGRRRLFLLSPHRPWFPTLLEELDSSGRVVSEYFASGVQRYLSRLTFRGQEALALAGYNNETRGGSLTILSMDAPSGRSPAENSEYLCLTCPPRDPLTIIVTPRSDSLGAISPDGTAYVSDFIAIDNGVINVNTVNGAYPDSQGRPQSAGLSYRFTPDLSRLLEMSPDPHLITGHDDLFKAGRLDHPFGPRDLAALRRVLAWDGRRWTPLPTR